MPGWYNEYPSRKLLSLRKAWREHYIAKGCSTEKSFWLAAKKTHTWPNGENV
jgi:hypothetical protein